MALFPQGSLTASVGGPFQQHPPPHEPVLRTVACPSVGDWVIHPLGIHRAPCWLAVRLRSWPTETQSPLLHIVRTQALEGIANQPSLPGLKRLLGHGTISPRQTGSHWSPSVWMKGKGSQVAGRFFGGVSKPYLPTLGRPQVLSHAADGWWWGRVGMLGLRAGLRIVGDTCGSAVSPAVLVILASFTAYFLD